MSPSGAEALASCLGISGANVVTDPVGATGPDIASDESDNAPIVYDTVEVFPTALGAIADEQAAASSHLPDCPGSPDAALQFSYESSAGAGGAITPVRFRTRAIPAFGQHDVDVALYIPGEGVSEPVYTDQVIVQVGRSVSILDFATFDEPTPLVTIDQLARAAAARLTAP